MKTREELVRFIVNRPADKDVVELLVAIEVSRVGLLQAQRHGVGYALSERSTWKRGHGLLIVNATSKPGKKLVRLLSSAFARAFGKRWRKEAIC